MMALVLGGLSFVLYNQWSNEDDKPVAQKQELTPKVKAEPSLSQVDNLLKTKDLKFSTVDNLCKQYLSQRDITENSANKAAFQRLYDYQKVIGFIRDGKVDSITKVVESKYMYELYDIHQKALELIVKDDNNKRKFQSDYKNLKGFDDIRTQYSNDTPKMQKAFEIGNFYTEKQFPNKNRRGQANVVSVKPKKEEPNKQQSSNSQFVCTKGCKIGGSPLRFKRQDELDAHMSVKHNER